MACSALSLAMRVWALPMLCGASAMHSATSLTNDRARLVRSEYRTPVDLASSSQVLLSAHGDMVGMPNQVPQEPIVVPVANADDWSPGDKHTKQKNGVSHSEDSKMHETASSVQSNSEAHQDNSAESKVDMGFQTVPPSIADSKDEKDASAKNKTRARDKGEKEAKDKAKKAEGRGTENLLAENLNAENLLSNMEPHIIAQIQSQLVAAKHARVDECGEEGCHDYCLEDFPLGIPDTNACVSAMYHTLILDRSMCEEAARQANATEGIPGHIPDSPFVINNDYADYYPQGCFKIHGSGAYFYNPAGTFPKWPMGIPVCYRIKFANGTADTDGGCPGGFQRIMDEDACRSAAKCQGFCINDDDFQFGVNVTEPATDTRMPDAWRYDWRPAGCFIHPTDNCTYFNVPRNESPAGPISGIPMCNTSEHVIMDALTSPLL
mmetsp:Transcript_99996/g.173506  ORF Transcript_99996/g.173506 Transcript_99996/m.173506 type:complete len:436 (-) Transcript_99996:55-1362(-)